MQVLEGVSSPSSIVVLLSVQNLLALESHLSFRVGVETIDVGYGVEFDGVGTGADCKGVLRAMPEGKKGGKEGGRDLGTKVG